MKLSVTLSNLNRLKKFCTAGKHMKFATKPMRQYPSHLRHVATLPWEIKNSIFLQIFSRHCRNANILHYNRL